MRNLLVANWRHNGRVSREDLKALVDAQVENSLALNWQPNDILIMANFPHEYQGVRTEVVDELNTHCLRGSKMFALNLLLRSGRVPIGETVWAHDLDAWQNHRFAAPDFADLGIAEYSQPKFNGGSVFARHSARDIVSAIVQQLVAQRADREEPTINRILRSAPYRGRVTVVNPTYNLGCSGFAERFRRSSKPIVVSHFHPTNKIAWDTHVNDRNGLGPSTSPRLIELLVQRFHGGCPPAKLVRSKKTKVRCSDGR
jgi:hypothetical protein